MRCFSVHVFPYKEKTCTGNRGGGTSLNLGGPLLNFHLQCSLGRASRHLAQSLALIRRCISGSQYSGKLTTSSSTRLSTFIIQNSSLNCGFQGKYYLLGNIWGSLYSPPQAKILEIFAHFKVLRSNLAKILTTGHPFWGGQWSKFWGGGPKHALAHPLRFLGGPWPPCPPPPPPPPPGSATPDWKAAHIFIFATATV